MDSGNLSTGESAIYDRQLRLWGSNAQMRIKNSTVALIGLTASTVEIVKNLILAGSSLVLQDDRPVNEETSNFLIKLELDDTSNLTVSEATCIAAHRLNEHPSVHAKSDALSLPVSAVVVSLSYLGYKLDEAVRISGIARSMGAAFFLIVDSGSICWSFSDFGKLHVVEDYTPPLKRDDRTGHRATISVHEELEFVSLSEFIESEIRFSKKIHSVSYMIYWMKFFVSSETNFANFLNSFSLSADIIESYVSIESVMNTSVCAPHFAAIQGALVAQEIIKFVTKRDPPLVNTVSVDQVDCSCIVWKQPVSLGKKIIEQSSENDVEVVVTEEELI